MRIDTTDFRKLANRDDQPIKGTTAWRRYGIVLDVPKGAHRIAFGVWLAGSGTVWMNRVEVESIDPAAPGNGIGIDPVRGAVNLDFLQR